MTTSTRRDRQDRRDRRFMTVAATWASFSKDPSTKVGCVIVDVDGCEISQGYNGPPRDIRDRPELFERPIKYMVTVHAEANAVAQAARTGRALRGCIAYITHPPCAQCAALLMQAGIEMIVIPVGAELRADWAENLRVAREMLFEAGIGWSEVEMPPAEGQRASCHCTELNEILDQGRPAPSRM